MFIDSVLGGQLARAMVGISFDLADAGRTDSMGELERLVASLDARVVEARETFAAAADLAERVRDGRETMPDAERPARIEAFSGYETTFAEIGRLMVPRALANEARAAASAPRLLPLLRRMTGLIEEETRLLAEAVREVRWALLELEAAAEPPADGPILSSPAELGAYFNGLRAKP